MNSFDDDENNKDDGSIWTSYSDMFTTMSVIFLVMFIFALLRSGVNTVKVAKKAKEDRELLEAKVSIKTKMENKKSVDDLSQSIIEMEQFNNMINSKMTEMNKFSEKMKKHKVIIKKLLKNQEKNEAAMTIVAKKLKDKDIKISISKLEIKKLKFKLKDKIKDIKSSLHRNISLQSIRTKLETNIVDWQEKVTLLKRNVEKLRKDKSKLNKNIKRNKHIQKEEVSFLNDVVKNLEQNLQEKKSKLVKIDQVLFQSEEIIKKQSVSLSEIQKKLTSTKSNNKKIKKLIDQLKHKIVDISSQVLNYQNDIKQKSKINQSLRNNIKTLSQSLNGKASTIKRLVAEVDHEKNNNLKSKLTIQKLNESLKQEGMLNSRRFKQIQKLNKSIATINGQLSKEEDQNEKLGLSIKGEKSQNKALKETNGQLQKLVSGLSKKIGKSEKLSRAKDSQIGSLNNKINQFNDKLTLSAKTNRDLSKKLGEMNNRFRHKISEMEKLKNKNKRHFNRVQRKIASIQENFRQNIGRKLANRLSKANINAYVDPLSGSVILRMDDSFLFKRNSSQLKNIAKNALKKIIPLYVSELFGDLATASKIANINIIGHASPRWNRKVVDPDKSYQEAYNYNLDLSSNRAREIVKYIFSKKFSKFKHKWSFRKKVQAIGMSFSKPILRKPSSTDNGCGKYDCKKSRRVEISFTLKDNQNVWSKMNFSR